MYKVPTTRAAPAVKPQPSAAVLSADGSRWVTARNYKASADNHTYRIVRAWRLWERLPGKRAVLMRSGMDDGAASAWIGRNVTAEATL